MTYFQMFPNVLYSAIGDGKFTVMKDLMSRVKLINNVKENILGFDYYDVKDGETPEMIAHKYYDDWPMSTQRFEQFVKEKYDNPQGIHHYEITQTSGDTTVTVDVGTEETLVEEDYPTATAISNYQYEDKLQEKKRQIRLITPEYIDEFVKEFERKMNEAK